MDIRADLYSLGCTLYRLLAGRAPFEDAAHGTLYSKLQAHEQESPPPIGEFRRDLPRRLVAILDRLLAKEPAQQFSAPGELAAALAPLAAGSDLPALEASGDTRTASACVAPTAVTRRHETRSRRWIWIGTGLAVVLVALVTGRVFVARQDGRKPQIVAGQPPRPAEGTAATAASRLPGWIVLSWACEAAGKPSLWLFRPGGTQLLCARRESSGAGTQLLLMDDRFRVTGQLFSLDVPSWHPEDREFGNLAGWAVVPADVPLPNAG